MYKIGIVGANIREEQLKEYEDEYELWAVNNLFQRFKKIRWGKYFDIHDFSKVDSEFYSRRGFNYYPIDSDITVKTYLEGLNNLTCIKFLKRKIDLIKDYAIFPFDALIKKYGEYFGCSFAWLTAFAIKQDPDEIGYFGTVLGGNEYYYQRPSTEYLIGIAKGLGIKIFNHQTSNLLKETYLYAAQEDFDLIYLLHGEFAKKLGMKIYTAIQEEINHFIWPKVKKNYR